jgi:hypothetical protein
MIDGNEGNYWDWGYAPSGNAYGSTNANTENDSNASDYGLSPRTRQENGSGHPATMTPLGLAPAHFLTIDLGEIKNNISRVWYLPRNAGTHIAQYEIWVSDTDIGVNPQAEGATKVAEGNWSWTSKIWLAAEFALCSARYIQIRSLADGDGQNLQASGTNWFSVGGCEINVDIYGGFDGTISTANLESTYQDGIQVLGTVKNNPVKFNRLNTLLHGSLGSDGEILVKGAKQYLEDRPAIESDVDACFEYQNGVDDITRQIRLLLSALQGPSNS